MSDQKLSVLYQVLLSAGVALVLMALLVPSKTLLGAGLFLALAGWLVGGYLRSKAVEEEAE